MNFDKYSKLPEIAQKEYDWVLRNTVPSYHAPARSLQLTFILVFVLTTALALAIALPNNSEIYLSASIITENIAKIIKIVFPFFVIENLIYLAKSVYWFYERHKFKQKWGVA